MLLRFPLSLLACALLSAQTFNPTLITTLAGSGQMFVPGATALTSTLPPGAWGKPAVDPAGNIYFSLTAQNVVLRLTPAGRLEAYAGNGFARFSGDGGAAASASLNGPRDVAVDSRGILYIADTGNKRIRRVLPSRVIDTFAGGGAVLPTSGGVRLADASLPSVAALAVDGSDNVYANIDGASIARVDYGSAQIRLYSGAQFRAISALSADKAGNLYVADAGAISIVRITAAGRVDVLTTRSATYGVPVDVAVDAAGMVYFAQNASAIVWRLQPNNNVDIYSGSEIGEGYTPSGTARERARYGNELRLAVDGQGSVIVGDSRNGRLRRVSAVTDTLAGAGLEFSGDAGPATAAVFYSPHSIAQSRTGTLYFSDAAARLILSIDAQGIVRRFAGNGVLNAPYADGRAASEGAFGTPYGVAVDTAGMVYVADDDCAIRRLGADGAMRLHGGVPGLCGNAQDGTALKDMRFGRLRGLTIDAGGNMYVTDITNHKVWRIGADGVVRTFAGTGAPGTTTTSLPAVQSPLNTPLAVAVAGDGNVYIADHLNNRVVRIGSDMRLTTFAGVGQRASTGDNGPASSAAVNLPAGLAVDAAGSIYIAEMGGNRVRRVNAAGTIGAYAGTGVAGASGDGGFAMLAQLAAPMGLLLTPDGQLAIADRDNGRLRLVLNAPPPLKISTAPVAVTPATGEFIQRGTVDLPAPLPGVAFEASVRYPTPGAAGWLTVTPERGTLPASLTYETNSGGLAAGDYTAQIVISVPSATPRESAIPVTLRVPAPPSRPFLVAGNSRLTMSALRGATAQRTVPVVNTGGTPLVIRSAVAAGAFLAVAPAELTVAPGQTGSFTVTASAGALLAGTYSGAIRFSSPTLVPAVSASFNLSFNVSAARSRLVVSQTGLSFRAVAGGAIPLPQTIYAAGAERLGARATTVSGAAWLTAAAAGNQVAVTVNPREMAAGDYYGRLEIFDTAAPTLRQFVTVLLQVLPAGSDPGPDLVPSALLYTASVGGEVTGQDVQLVLPSNRRAAFTATGATFQGQPWLLFSPSGGAVTGDAPGRVTVQPDLTGLAAGIYRGSVTLTLDDGQTRTVSILAIANASATLTSKSGEREASSCTNTGLFPQVLSPASNFLVTAGEPLRLATRVVDGCGNPHQPESGGNAAVAVTGFGTQVVNLTHTGGGVWEGTATPNSVQTAATLTFLGLFSRGTFLQAGADKVNGAVAAAQRPVLFSDSLTDAASFQFGVPVAPGTLVSLFGLNLNASNAVPSALPLPDRLGDVEVRLNDQPIPLLFAGPGQVNAQIPYALDADTEYQLEIRRGSAIATPQAVVIARSRPGIFTVDQSGQGQGHIYRALGDGSQRLADAAGGAAAGEVLVIYCNGLGLTTPAVTAGAAAPFSPLAETANPVTLTIGGQNATIVFAGLAPGFAGLYQVNAVVPSGVVPNGAAPAVLTVAGQSSVPVTMGIR